MSGYIGDKAAGDTIYMKFTSINSSGVPTAITTPVLAVYKNNSTTETLTGLTVTAAFDGLTGLYQIAIDTSQDGTFYANGNDFSVIIVTGTVSSNSVVGYMVGEFSLRNRAFLYPTTAGRTLDVSSGGEAGLDWANIGSPTTTVNLSGTTVKTATDVETDTQDIQSRIPAALGANGNIKADIRDFNGTVGTFASGRPEVNTTHWKGTAAATPDTAGYPVVTIKDGTGQGEIATTSGAVDTVTSVTNGITVSTNNDKTGYSLSSAGIQAIWDALTSALITSGSIGKLLVDNINATISSRSSHSAADVWAVGTRTLTSFGTLVADILAGVIETGLTLKNALRLIAASTAGKLSGAATTQVTIRNAVADDKDRIIATVDSDGNRTSITYDLS